MAKAKEKEALQEENLQQEETAEETTQENELSKEEKEKAYWNERVPLMIPRDPSNPKESEKVIIINGYAYQIKRGTQVMVPRKVYQAYMDSEAQKARAMDFAEGAKDKN